MTNITPEEARRWLKEGMEKGSVPQLHARRALETIANLTWEYGEQHIVIPERLEHTTWGVNPEEVRQLPGYGDYIRLFRRLVTQPKEVKP